MTHEPLLRRLLGLLLVLTLAWAGAATQGDAVAAAWTAEGTPLAAPADVPDGGTVQDHHLDDAPAQSAWGGDLPLADTLPAHAAGVPADGRPDRCPATPADARRPDAPARACFKPPRG
ncbi:hypothetical protein EV684_107242 [Rubrivivax gelatinosus]|uniref:Secreted protein n=1 Tax=Rubrivivax gelatinosus TaxID=28068 RepID=A0A4R2MHH3_RUBGE|nr:hypothetical protein [Rubrivivax gelatinosus]TCP02236.1 hypothetical protein EV684_107242 [Rubrivivax gelatinosus]